MQVAADQGAGRAGHAAQSRPRADGPGAVGGPKRRLEDGQAGRGQEGAADPLDNAGDNEKAGARGPGRRARMRGRTRRRRARRSAAARSGRPMNRPGAGRRPASGRSR